MHCILMKDSPQQMENVQSTHMALFYLLKTWPDWTLDCKSALHRRWEQSGHNLQTRKLSGNIILIQAYGSLDDTESLQL